MQQARGRIATVSAGSIGLPPLHRMVRFRCYCAGHGRSARNSEIYGGTLAPPSAGYRGTFAHCVEMRG